MNTRKNDGDADDGDSRKSDSANPNDQAEIGSIESKLVAAEAMLLQNWAIFIAAKLLDAAKDQ